MADKITAPMLRRMRAKGQRIACVTAYDAAFGAMADAAGVDVILVGDSVGNTTLGYADTIPVTLAEMVHHTKAVRAGVRRALLVADLPLGSYNASTAQAVESAAALAKVGADAVKLEGVYPEAIEAIQRMGVPVMGHLGFTPQAKNRIGGAKVQGRGEEGEVVMSDAVSVDEAGVFAMVLELIPGELAKLVTERVGAPTIGIGAGIHCSGEIQVLHDVLGLEEGTFRHAKRYLQGRELIVDALRSYAAEVRENAFPGPENTF
ncbi:3-methyl-2-oxobutanoate hydroxymethyltransferase [bacterium]|nr:MAG: 3-methyl-2-oxobutanoate hydroxymethyltransferase [bacterium]